MGQTIDDSALNALCAVCVSSVEKGEGTTPSGAGRRLSRRRCGPMSGFDNAKVDEEFLATGKPGFGSDEELFPDGHVKSNFLCNLGYGNPRTLFPRLLRLPFSEACSVLWLRCAAPDATLGRIQRWLHVLSVRWPFGYASPKESTQDFWDPVKFIPFGSARYDYLTIGGKVREWYESFATRTGAWGHRTTTANGWGF
jgi:hypothetical protein